MLLVVALNKDNPNLPGSQTQKTEVKLSPAQACDESRPMWLPTLGPEPDPIGKGIPPCHRVSYQLQKYPGKASGKMVDIVMNYSHPHKMALPAI